LQKEERKDEKKDIAVCKRYLVLLPAWLLCLDKTYFNLGQKEGEDGAKESGSVRKK
jgi:hypothetical protein